MPGPRILLLLAVVIAGSMLFARLGQLPLRDPDEGRNAQVAREMEAAGAWLTPSFNGLTYLDKPAFFFKAIALSFSLFGESETTARLPSAVFAAALLAVVYGFCRREYDTTTAAISIMVLGTTPEFVALARHVIFDMMLGFFVCVGIFAGYFAEAAEGTRQRNWYLLGAASLGCATLVKGPVGFLVPTVVLSIFNIVDSKAGWWRRCFHPLNLLVFFGITLPWFIGLSRLHPDFPHYGLVEESFNRFTTGSFHRHAPFYYYGLVILGGLFAWSSVFPEAARAAWRGRARWSRADRFLIVWVATVVIFFSISKSKLPHYILSALVALGILTARIFARALKNKGGLAARVISRSLVFLVVLCALAGVFLIINILDPNAHETLFKIRAKEFGRVSLLFVPAACIFVILGVVALMGYCLRDVRIALTAFLILPLSVLTIGFDSLVRYSEASSARELVRSIPTLAPKTTVVCLQCFPCGLPFYLHKPVTLISANGGEFTSNYIIYALKSASPWPPVVVRVAEQERWFASRQQPVYVIANDQKKAGLEAIAATYRRAITPLTPGWWGLSLPPKP